MNVLIRTATGFFWVFLLGTAVFLSAAEKGPASNEIDSYLGTRIAAKAESEPLVDDRGFLRRVWLDLTGRLPDPETTASFLADSRSGKRGLMVQQLLASEAFTDRWANFFGELFLNRALTEEGLFRNPFHFQIRQMVAQNMPWDQMARQILTFKGDATDGESSLMFWIAEVFEGDYRLDILDDQIGMISRAMLGMRINCISCHDGAYHLEDVNKGLSTMTRAQFWGMAAFLSKSYLFIRESPREQEDLLQAIAFVDLDGPGFSRDQGFLYAERKFQNGEYTAVSVAGEGMRPPRSGGVIQPAFLTTGEGPLPGETRREALARMITAQRQFARNMVNRIWAHLFGEGFVEPVDSWDPGRIDEAIAALNETTVQPRTPALMEFLTDLFIDNGYDLRNLIGQITNSKLYQWDYARDPDPDPNHPWGEWRANKRVRRIEAEAIVDSINQVLGLTPRYTVSGLLDRTYTSTWQMPDTYEPNPGAIFAFDDGGRRLRISPAALGYASLDEYLFQQYMGYYLLEQLGRGDRASLTPRKNETSIPNVLLLLNQSELNYWLELGSGVPLIRDLSLALEHGQVSRQDATSMLFRHILYREPTAGEAELFGNYFKDHDLSRSVRDMVWSLLNHPDFIHK